MIAPSNSVPEKITVLLNRQGVIISQLQNVIDAIGHTSASVDGGGAEGLPDDCLTDVGRNEKRDTRAQTVALLEQLVQQQDNQTCNKELKKPGRFQVNN